MKFIDRFNRQYIFLLDHNGVFYKEIDTFYFSRTNLPSFITSTGTICWNNTNNHLTNHYLPAFITMVGDMEYWLDDTMVTRMEAML